MLRIALLVRSILFFAIMVSVTIPWAFVCFLAALLPYKHHYYIVSRWNVFIIWLAKVMCGVRYQIKGAENLPDTPLILLSKHQSAWETIFLLCKMPRPLVFVFKRELLYIPFFGWALGLLRMIPINRSTGRDAFAQVVTHGRKRLADGQWVIIFPEGTRIPVGQRGKYKGGGTRLAVETNTAVLPIALNSGECWGKGSFVLKPGLVTVSIGKPIAPDGLNAVELMAMVENWIESEMKVISPERYPAN